MMKFLAAVAAAVVAISSPAWAGAPSRAKAEQTERVVLPKAVRPDRYEIHITPSAADLSFTGRVTIALTVLEATDRIVLNAADLQLKSASLEGRETPRIVLDDEQQTAAFVFAKPLAPGAYKLSIDYAGKIYQQASGLFALDYEGAGGKQRALFTQFQNSDGRRFAPMWDEPGVKSVFSLTVTVPQADMPVSNMPAIESKPLVASTASPGLKTVRFADSPKMSSYLLFFALGDFERLSKTVGKTDVGVVVRRGDTARAEFALDATIKTLGYFEDYFGTPYPLPKLDLIAGPGSSQFFAAMENWGAIFYFDYAVLIDPKLSTEADRQQVFITVAHEVAHQWFGNLVTMEWWDQLWLNEGFASWMENKATDHFHPEWNVWLSTQSGQQGAMRLDSRSGTHPIITPIRDVFAAADAFDSITYQKGQAVIRMLEAYVGEDAFRAGVRNYIKANAYGNAVSDDLWAELDKVSPRKVTDMAHDFTLQAGVPLIRATSAPGGIRLTQERFGAEPSQQTPRTWRTPVAVKGLDGKTWQGVVAAGAPQTVPVKAPAVVNAGQTSYFRTAYSPELRRGLAARFSELAPDDQLGLLNDSRTLGEAGVTPMSDFLALARNAGEARDPIVLQTLAEHLSAVEWLYEGQAGAKPYRGFTIDRLRPVAQRLGWDPKPGEADNDAITRRSVLGALGELGDAATVAEARRRFEVWLSDPGSLTGGGRRTVLGIVAANADAATWEILRRKAKESKDPTDRVRLYALLGMSDDPVLLDRALQLSLSGETSPTEAPGLIAAVAATDPDRAYDFAIAHRAKVESLLEPTSRTGFFAQLAFGSREPAMLEKLARYAATIPASSRGEVEKSAAAIRYRIAVIKAQIPEMDRWLAANGRAGPTAGR